MAPVLPKEESICTDFILWSPAWLLLHFSSLWVMRVSREGSGRTSVNSCFVDLWFILYGLTFLAALYMSCVHGECTARTLALNTNCDHVPLLVFVFAIASYHGLTPAGSIYVVKLYQSSSSDIFMEYFTVYGVFSERQWDTVIQSIDFAARLPGFSSQWGLHWLDHFATFSLCSCLSSSVSVPSLKLPCLYLSLSVSFPSPFCLLLFFSTLSLPSASLFPFPLLPSSSPSLLTSPLLPSPLPFSPQPSPPLLFSLLLLSSLFLVPLLCLLSLSLLSCFLLFALSHCSALSLALECFLLFSLCHQ